MLHHRAGKNLVTEQSPCYVPELKYRFTKLSIVTEQSHRTYVHEYRNDKDMSMEFTTIVDQLYKYDAQIYTSRSTSS